VRFAIPARTVHVASLPDTQGQTSKENAHKTSLEAAPEYRSQH
jgi:hypothetical protein